VQITVVDAGGTKTVAYDNVQAVNAPAAGYDGEVAAALNTASGVTQTVFAVPGKNGGLVDLPENQAYATAGVFSLQTLINNPEGALVAAAVSQAAVYGPESVTGPAVVPGNSKYTYIFHFPPIKPVDFNPNFTFGTSTVKLTTVLHDSNSNIVGLVVQASFANVPAIKTLTLTNWLRWEPNAVLTFPVTVVQVQVSDPDPKVAVAFLPNPIPSVIFPDENKFDTDTLRAAVKIDSSDVKNDADGLGYGAQVTLIGPNGNQGVNKIEAGFIQHATTSLQATYKPKQTLTAKYKGKPASDYIAMLDKSPGPLPWYQDTKDGVFKNATKNTNTALINDGDSPSTYVPLTYDKAPAGILLQNTWPDRKDLITRIDYKDTFTLDVAARTTDGASNASSLYYVEASVDWSFDGSGTFKLNRNAASPKDSVLDFTAAKNPAVVVTPKSWATVMATKLEDTSALTTDKFINAMTFS
jgi:hypothetical protein